MQETSQSNSKLQAGLNPNSKAAQAAMLTEHREIVKRHSQLMRRAIDANDMGEALKNAAVMVSELRTGLLTPKVYYDLYMDVFDGLGYLELYFTSLGKGGLPLSELYHKVQSAGQVLVRLYLLITAGSVYVRLGQAPAKVVLRDLLDMAKGVQHPQRGLFLRYFLAQKMKDKLPDEGSPYEGTGGDLRDALGFLLANFSEMNRLWVRMQHGIGEWRPRAREAAGRGR